MYGCSPKKYLSIYGKHRANRIGVERMITEREIRNAIAQWNIPQNLQLREVNVIDGTKVSENVWSLGDDYILKTEERSRLLKDLRLRNALAAQGFTALAPVLTKAGQDFLDGERIYILMKKIPGEPLKKTDRFGDERHTFGFKYGQSIARLHLSLADVEAAIMPDEVDLFKQVMKWALPNCKKLNEQWSMGLSDNFFLEYVDAFGAVFDKLPKQLIHRDPNPSNILFNDGEVSGFIDFDHSERNIRLWDPCYCATGILSEWRGVENIYEKWPDIYAGILLGYDSVCPLTAEEKESLFYVVCSIAMICAAYFGSVDEYKELSKTSREILTYIANNKECITKVFKTIEAVPSVPVLKTTLEQMNRPSGFQFPSASSLGPGPAGPWSSQGGHGECREELRGDIEIPPTPSCVLV
jgi:Ser/Thr protein kinase RdoA (MazF antagonist)